MTARKKLPPNDFLRDARLARLSPSGSGRPMSRQELAEQINAYLWKQYKRRATLDENDVGLLERGENRWPGKQRREAFRSVLDAATDAELGFYINRRPRADVVRTLHELPAPTSDEVIIVNVVVDGRMQAMRLSRRGLLEAVTGSVMAPLLSCAIEVRGPVNPAVVDHFAALRALLVESDNRLGPASVLPTVRHQLSLIAQFRRQSNGALHNRLLATEARWAEFAGWLCDDLGEDAEGHWWLSEAMSLAFGASDLEFSAYVLARKAQRAASTADQDRVLGLARTATRIGASQPHVLAFAALQRAHGHALAGETREFEIAVGDARTLVDGRTPRDGDLGSFCTPPYVIAQEGEGWLRLNQPKKAVSSFGQALASWPAPFQRDRGLYMSRTAVAQLASKQIDEAADTALQALKLAEATRSMRIRQEVVTVGQQLTEDRQRPAVAALLSALAVPAEDVL